MLGACTDSHQDKGAVKWKETVSGVWNVSVGTPEKVNLLSELHITPKVGNDSKMGEASLPVAQDDITFEVVDGKTYIRFPLERMRRYSV